MSDLTANPVPLSACPACDAAPLAQRLARRDEQAPGVILSLPAAHCVTCIAEVEDALLSMPGVRKARVNLTQRRVTVEADEIGAEAMIAKLASVGHEAHELDPDALTATTAARQGRDILMRIGVSGFAMMNIMILSVAVWSGAEGATRDMFHWISGAIALPTVLFAGQPFFRSAWTSIRAGRLGMDVPISLALILASAISIFETIHSGHHAYFDAAVMLCFFLLIGRYLDFRTRAVARSAAEELTALELPRAVLLRDGAEQVVAVTDLRPGDMILVRAGARVPADGVLVSGRSEIDRSLLTGESLPVATEEGMMLSTGEVNLTGPLVLRVTAAGRDSSLSRLAELVAAAESARGRYSSLAERASRFYSPTVHTLAALSFAGWVYATGDWRIAVNIAAAVLIITCPCALGLAVPAVVTAASGRLFRRGLLIKEGHALERLAEVDTVVFDKTGTLTLGRPNTDDAGLIPADLRGPAMTLAAASSHPYAQALAEALRGQGVQPADLSGITEHPGYGVSALWRGRDMRLGRASWVGIEDDGDDAASASWLAVEGHAPLRLRFTDSLRPGAAEAVGALQRAGKRVVLLSGDAEGPVADIAGRLGIAEWSARMMPEGKAAYVQARAAEGAHVLMVGDGLNDTAALAAAHVSISPASALDAARVASDIVLMGQGLHSLPDAIKTARSARRRIKENFAISALYNVVAIPFGMMGFVTPLWAALAMSLSSVCVTLNALRLR